MLHQPETGQRDLRTPEGSQPTTEDTSDLTLTATSAASSEAVSSDSGGARWLSGNPNSQEAVIRCQPTGRGLLLQSVDTEALDRFEEHLRAIAGPLDSIASPPVVFYLKYTRADDAIRMLAELLDGGEAAQEGEAGSLVNGYVSSGLGSYLSSMVTSRDGTTTMLADSMTVVADSRLNRLIAQGSVADVERIESYLTIIDKDSSITAIETYGTSQVIELKNTRASEVASAIRDAYSNRVTGTSSSKAGSGGQSSPEQAQLAAIAERISAAKDKEGSKKASSRQPSGQPERDLEPKMTIAVHEPSNSLIVTAPEQLFREVEQLARAIDSRGEQIVEVITPVNGAAMEAMLREVLLGEDVAPRATSKSAPPTRPTSSSRSSSNSPSSSRAKLGR